MSSLFFSFFFSLIIKPLFERSKEPLFFLCPKLLSHIYLFSHCLGPLSHMAPQMSSLFLLWLLFYYYWRKFSSARCSARISLWRSLTRCRAAFSLLSLRLREGLWKYLFLLRSLSVPSFIMRFLSFVTALSALSWRLNFTVSIWSVFGWGCMCAAAMQQLVLFFLYTSIVSRPVEFVKWHGAATRFTQIPNQGGRLEWGVVACRSASAWWRFGMCGIWCGWWWVEQRWIKMTCYTQQYVPISPLHRHNVI